MSQPQATVISVKPLFIESGFHQNCYQYAIGEDLASYHTRIFSSELYYVQLTYALDKIINRT